MSNPHTTARGASRLGLASWCLYDWANSAFPTIVTTFVFSAYFTRAVANNPVDGAVQWSHSVTAAALAVVLGAPALGAIADGIGRRKPWLFAFTALTVAATLGLWPVVLFRRGGQSENPWKPTLHVEQRGPFRITRNPMYLQMVLVCFGVALMLANVWILLLTPLAAWLLQRLAILPEEAYLERKFGAEYRSYKARVRRWI